MTTPLVGTKTAAGRWGPAIMFTLGYFMLPPGKARQHYVWATLGLIGGFLLLGQRFDKDGLPPVGMEWWEVYYITPWSVMAWLFGLYNAYRLIVMIRYFRAERRAAAERYYFDGDAAFEDDPEPSPGPAPVMRTVVEAGATERPQTAVERYEPLVERAEEARATVRSGLILPSHTERRVRRGGATLSGVPIKDRRATDPRTL